MYKTLASAPNRPKSIAVASSYVPFDEDMFGEIELEIDEDAMLNPEGLTFDREDDRPYSVVLKSKVYKGKFNGAVKAIQQYSLFSNTDEENKRIKDSLLAEVGDVRYLEGPRIVHVDGFIYAPPLVSFVMEHMSNGSLREYLDSGAPLEWHQRKQFMVDIISGLSFLYNRNVTHGDLQSANIFLDQNMRGKVLEPLCPISYLSS